MAQRQPSPGSLECVVRYYRNSRGSQEDSIERQHSIIDPWSAKKPWKILDDIEDPDITGITLMDRPGVRKILALVRAGKIHGIATDDWDRLLRVDSIEMGEFLGPLRRAGVWIESAAQGRFDYNTMGGRINMSVTAEAKHDSSVSTAYRVLTKHLNMARDHGKPPLAKPAYGYARIEDLDKPIKASGRRPGKIMIEEQEAAIVRQIFEWYAAGRQVGWIQKELKRRAVPSPNGAAMWQSSTIRRLLRRRVYVGDRCWGQKASGKLFRRLGDGIIKVNGKCKQELKPQEEWLIETEAHPAIISRDMWERVQSRIKRAAVKEVLNDAGEIVRREGEASTPGNSESAFVLSKLLVCGRCGAWMTGSTRQSAGGRVRYTCARYNAFGVEGCVRCEVKEEEVLSNLIVSLRDLLSTDRQQMLRKKLKEVMATERVDASLKLLRKRRQQLEGEVQQCRQRLTKVPEDMIQEVAAVLRQTLQEQRENLEALDQAERANPVKDLQAALDTAVKAVWDLEQAIEQQDMVALREALHWIIDKVVVDPKPRTTKRGGERFKPGECEVVLRPDTGLDVLANVEHSPRGTPQVLYINSLASA